jgi:hypothetical protein
LRSVVAAKDFPGAWQAALLVEKHSPGAMENKSRNEGEGDEKQGGILWARKRPRSKE